MYLTKEALVVTTSSSGYVSTATSNIFNGFVQSIVYAPSTSVPYSTGSNVAISAGVSAAAIISLDNASSGTYYPRLPTHTATGAASTGHALISLVNEGIAVIVTSGSTDGVAKVGTFTFYVGG